MTSRLTAGPFELDAELRRAVAGQDRDVLRLGEGIIDSNDAACIRHAYESRSVCLSTSKSAQASYYGDPAEREVNVPSAGELNSAVRLR